MKAKSRSIIRLSTTQLQVCPMNIKWGPCWPSFCWWSWTGWWLWWWGWQGGGRRSLSTTSCAVDDHDDHDGDDNVDHNPMNTILGERRRRFKVFTPSPHIWDLICQTFGPLHQTWKEVNILLKIAQRTFFNANFSKTFRVRNNANWTDF